MAPPRTLHIRCGTWDQVEAFYSRKLRRGRLLSMRVPFAPAISSDLSIGLELPSHEVITIDGIVRKCETGEDSRHWIEIELVGLSDELLRRLRDQVAEGAAAKARAAADSDVTPVPAVPTTLEPTPTVLARPSPTAAAKLAEGPPAPAPPAPAPPAPAPPAPSSAALSSPSRSPRSSAPPPLSSSPASSSSPSRSTRATTPPPSTSPPLRTPLAPPVSEDTVPRAPRLEDGPLRAPRVTVPMPPVAEGEDLPGDERELFAELSSELRRLRQVAVHEVFNVSRDANAEEIRAGWMAHIRRFHPDVMARHRSDAVSHLAEELTILGNRAYDRLRVALVAEGRGASFGPALFTPHGWLVGFEDLSTSDVPAARVLAASRPLTPAVPLISAEPAGLAASPGGRGSSSSAASSATASSGGENGFEHLPSGAATRTGESFEAHARELLASGDSSGAREVLATALVVYPRSRPLRSLYYVASALTALAAGQVVLATSQLETALAHHEGCVEASLILDQIHKNGGRDHDVLRRLFQ